jgi:hypothetical protein
MGMAFRVRRGLRLFEGVVANGTGGLDGVEWAGRESVWVDGGGRV